MPGDHTCPDCGRKFASGAALGGHRRVHTKGRLTKNKSRRRNQSQPILTHNTHNTNNTQFSTNSNGDYIVNVRGSPEPYSTEQKFYGEYITDLSSSENSDYISDSDNDKYWNSNEFTAMPPPIKKRKLNNNLTGPESIGYVIQSPINLKKPSKMDAIREQIGLAMTLYHFNVNKLAEYCDIPKQIFIKWLQGGIEQKKNIGVNSNNNNNNNNTKNDKSLPKKATKTPIFKIKIKRSQIQKAQVKVKSQEKGYYLTGILADQIAEKMKIWLDNFIKNGFMDKKYLKFVHHYKRYKKHNKNESQHAHSFDNLDMKWNKIKINNEIESEMNNNPMFDWNDDSSFYYKVNANKSENIKPELVPIEINEIIKGKPYKDSFLWNINNSESELKEFINCLCNDLKEYKNEKLKENIYKCAMKQMDTNNKIVSEYNNSLNKFGNKIPKRSYNYLQHLKKKNIICDNSNLMNNITDICHGHVLIKLDIKHGKMKLVDKFLWNINDISNNNDDNIEQFANILCADQGLPFNFATSIAIQIRKQINEYKIKMTKSMNNNGNNLNTINDPLSHESLRFVGRNKQIGLKNLKIWQPNIFVHKPPNTMKTKVRE